jgi:hypothetical protein
MDTGSAGNSVLRDQGFVGDELEALRRLLQPFWEQKVPKVFLSICCGRLYAGREPPVKCRTCGRLNPTATEVGPETDLSALELRR